MQRERCRRRPRCGNEVYDVERTSASRTRPGAERPADQPSSEPVRARLALAASVARHRRSRSRTWRRRRRTRRRTLGAGSAADEALGLHPGCPSARPPDSVARASYGANLVTRPCCRGHCASTVVRIRSRHLDQRSPTTSSASPTPRRRAARCPPSRRAPTWWRSARPAGVTTTSSARRSNAREQSELAAEHADHGDAGHGLRNEGVTATPDVSEPGSVRPGRESAARDVEPRPAAIQQLDGQRRMTAVSRSFESLPRRVPRRRPRHAGRERERRRSQRVRPVAFSTWPAASSVTAIAVLPRWT